MTTLQFIELFATIFGILFVVLRMRQSIWCWPIGLLYIFPTIYLCYQWKLYSDLWLHIIYIGTTFYGWWYWAGGKFQLTEQQPIPVVRLGAKGWAATLGFIALGVAAIGAIMSTKTDAAYPYLDAWTSVGALTAEFLATRKVFENWIFWIVINATAFQLYVYRGATFYAALYLVFLVLSFAGFFAWREKK